jgi:hypothetical protein
MRILILDLKSGWFAGDGGNTFQNFVFPQCPTQTQIVYIHLTQTLIEGTVFSLPSPAALLPCISALGVPTPVGPQNISVPDVHLQCTLGDVSAFNQIWVLGGSESDKDDIPMTSPLFASISTKLRDRAQRSPRASFFFGAGLGNTQHADRLARSTLPEVFGTSAVFAPQVTLGESGSFPLPENFRSVSAHQPLLPGKGSVPGQFEASHPIFVGMQTLMDFTSDAHAGQCASDVIVADVGIPLSTDACGQKNSVAGKSAAGHAYFLEANMPRFYATKADQWFNRIVQWMGTPH